MDSEADASSDHDVVADDALPVAITEVMVPRVSSDEQWQCRREVFRDGRRAWDLRGAGHCLGVHMDPNGFVKDLLQDRIVGRSVLTFAGTTVSATCQVHSKCKMLLPLKVTLGLGLAEAQVDAYGWIAAGTVLDELGHRELSKHLRKTIYKMRIT